MVGDTVSALPVRAAPLNRLSRDASANLFLRLAAGSWPGPGRQPPRHQNDLQARALWSNRLDVYPLVAERIYIDT